MMARFFWLVTVSVATLFIAAEADERPVVIAHRGACAYVPEHTLESYAIAHVMGADYIEPDLVLTKDKVFICLHDIKLDSTTNVKQIFPDRHRDDGHWYAADFTLDEIKRLSAHERLTTRFPMDKSHFEVPTFTEMIELIQGLNKTTGREAGIYPELKEPSWHRKQGLPMEEALIAILTKYGYTGKNAKVYVQCFEPDSLRMIRNDLKSELPLIQLLAGAPELADLCTRDGLKKVATYANGIGPDKEQIEKNPDLVKWAHAAGLAVHPYTFRYDDVAKRYANYEVELTQFLDTYHIDGLFTDNTDKALQVIKNIPKKSK